MKDISAEIFLCSMIINSKSSIARRIRSEDGFALCVANKKSGDGVRELFENTESEWVKHRLYQYMSEAPCATCGGARLKKEVLSVRLHIVDQKGKEKFSSSPIGGLSNPNSFAS